MSEEQLHLALQKANELIEQQRVELARVQRLPRLSWAQATASFMMRAAIIARAGFDVKPMVATLDALKTFVNDREVEIDALQAQLETS